MQQSRESFAEQMQIREKSNDAIHEGFKITWEKLNIDDDGVEHNEEVENGSCKINHIRALESHALRDRAQHNNDFKANKTIIAIVNSCDGAAHPVTRNC